MSIALPLVRDGIVRGACPHDCPDTCAMLVEVRDGRAVRVRGDPDHPVTQGFLCAKVNRYVERVYHPDRVTVPLRRVGPKGGGRFEPASWAEALDDISRRLQAIVAEHGPESVLPYSYAGTLGLVQGASMDRRFFHRLGASLLARTICSEAGAHGWMHTYGERLGPSPEEADRARLIVLWGTNTLTSNPHLWPALARARENGARLLAIDPIRTRTAERCDLHLPIRPGTDAALALGMMHVILRDGLEDRDYLERFTHGWERLPARAAEWPPERAAAITGLDAGQIEALATEYATTRPSLIRLNYGMQRHAGGGMAVRTVSLLPAVTGAWRDVGGGAVLATSGAFHPDRAALQRPDWTPAGTRTVNMNRLGEALTEPDAGVGGPPIMALFVYNANPAASTPDSAAVRRGLRRPELLTVVLEHFLTDTADHADWILPATTQLEHWDLHTAYGHHYFVLNRPSVEPLGAALPNAEIFRRLARAMGMTDPEFEESDVELIRLALRSDHPWMRGVTFERLLEDGHARVSIPRDYAPYAAPERLATPTGRIQIEAPELAHLGLDPLPDYVPPREWTDGSDDRLMLVTPPAHTLLNSMFAEVPALRAAAGRTTVLLHPDDAAARGLSGGETARVANQRGGFDAEVVVTDAVRPGTAVSHGVKWPKHAQDGRNVNETTSQALTDLGGGATFYDNAVTVTAIAVGGAGEDARREAAAVAGARTAAARVVRGSRGTSADAGVARPLAGKGEGVDHARS